MNSSKLKKNYKKNELNGTMLIQPVMHYLLPNTSFAAVPQNAKTIINAPINKIKGMFMAVILIKTIISLLS